jgi:short-subunit dehydrogenase
MEKPAKALITGASSGIGAEFARRLAARGTDLVLVARREDRLVALAGELRERFGIRAETLRADLSDPAGIADVEARIAATGGLDLLINNAGFGTAGKFAEIEPGKPLEMIDVHLTATVRLTRAALPGMIARHRGAVINVSSLAAFFPMPGSAVYAASKSFLNVFSESLALELRGAGVRVQALCPGFTYTEFHDTAEFARFQRSQVPKWLWMTASDVVSASLEALGRDKVIVLPGWRNRAIGALGRTGLASAVLKIYLRLRKNALKGRI